MERVVPGQEPIRTGFELIWARPHDDITGSSLANQYGTLTPTRGPFSQGSLKAVFGEAGYAVAVGFVAPESPRRDRAGRALCGQNPLREFVVRPPCDAVGYPLTFCSGRDLRRLDLQASHAVARRKALRAGLRYSAWQTEEPVPRHRSGNRRAEPERLRPMGGRQS